MKALSPPVSLRIESKIEALSDGFPGSLNFKQVG